MTSREKIRRAISHQSGPVAVDFGSTAVTGIHASVVAALRRYFGLADTPVKVHEPYQMLGLVEDDLLDAMGADATGIIARNTMFGFPNENWREWETPWGQTVLVPENFRTRPAPGGGLHIFPEGDISAGPSGLMPAGGYFFDAVIRQEPINEDALDPADNCEEFTDFSDADIAHWRREIARAAAGPRAVVAAVGGTALGDIALVPAPFMKKPRGVRDVTEWYVSLMERRDYVRAVFEHESTVALRNLERFAALAGDAVDVVYLCGTDFGTQQSQFCSPATFDELYAPYYKRINDWIHARTKWKTFKHTCGAVVPLIPGLIEAGFDILNPVQCSAKDMDPRRLKNEFGRDVVFWGGGVNTQETLPFGTPAQVYDEVLERLRIFAPGGGFVFNTIHNIQARTPVENIAAMLDAIRDHNKAGG
ncbi:hypothetical protein OH491_15825 [Termitidicoccus mucosus]|uniref:Methyltransferase n=2 Tax=Termitidicoccus mucosus TaxID=1184151 RepID=A0A178IHX3_9BACT|nr:methyltransferase [Opitutaceae bacterium TSB47]